MNTTRQVFTDDFKREAVGLLVSSGRPLTQIARELGIAHSILRSWRDARESGPAAELATKNARLRRENERLRMEREILKKTPRIFPEAPE